MHTFLALLLIVQPVANLNSAKTTSGLFYTTAALCLFILANHRFVGAGQLTRNYLMVISSFSVLLLAVAGSSLQYGHWAGANGEAAIRLFFGFWVLLQAMQYVPEKYLQWAVTLGFCLGGLASAGIVLYLALPSFIRPMTPAHKPLLTAIIWLSLLSFPLAGRLRVCPGRKCS